MWGIVRLGIWKDKAHAKPSPSTTVAERLQDWADIWIASTASRTEIEVVDNDPSEGGGVARLMGSIWVAPANLMHYSMWLDKAFIRVHLIGQPNTTASMQAWVEKGKKSYPRVFKDVRMDGHGERWIDIRARSNGKITFPEGWDRFDPNK